MDALEALRGFGAATIVPGHGAGLRTRGDRRRAGYLGSCATSPRAATGRAAPLEAARETDLGHTPAARPERIVGNLHRAMAELAGAERGAPVDILAAFADMIAFNGGAPLRCLA